MHKKMQSVNDTNNNTYNNHKEELDRITINSSTTTTVNNKQD